MRWGHLFVGMLVYNKYYICHDGLCNSTEYIQHSDSDKQKTKMFYQNLNVDNDLRLKQFT